MDEQRWAPRFFTIWIGQQLSWIGSGAGGFALVWWLTQETGSAQVLATATMGIIVPTVLLGPVAGTYDRSSGGANRLGNGKVSSYVLRKECPMKTWDTDP